MTTPLHRVRYLGSAHDGTDHFWRQRLTGAANAILVVCLLGVAVSLVGAPYGQTAAIVGSPFVAALLVLLFVSAGVHMRLGMQTIIEDYIHGEGLKVVLLVASTFFTVAVVTVAILAILKLAIGS
jgi:succinate dehydrogenase / fumarate reductase membrane anchor subunit